VKSFLLAFLFLLAPVAIASNGPSTDSELLLLQSKLTKTSDPLLLAALHLNVGDIRSARNEWTPARAAYEEALRWAGKEALRSRRRSDLARYARSVAYEGLAHAKLFHAGPANQCFEEALRYQSNVASTWNLYSSAMTVLDRNEKAVAAARVAVYLGHQDAFNENDTARALDLAVYQYSLANALARRKDATSHREAHELLSAIISRLESETFNGLRRRIARSEAFEVFSSAEGDESAFIALRNRARQRKAQLLEQEGSTEKARSEYDRLLEDRSDDPAALAALARLSTTSDRRAAYYETAFESDPLSIPLIRDYEIFLESAQGDVGMVQSAGSRMRSLLLDYRRSRFAESERTLRTLIEEFPQSATLQYLLARVHIRQGKIVTARQIMAATSLSAAISSELETLMTAHVSLQRQVGFLDDATDIAKVADEKMLSAVRSVMLAGGLSTQHKKSLDKQLLRARVTFDRSPRLEVDTVTFAAGKVSSVPFRFAAPVTFRGDFRDVTGLELEFRILGVLNEEAEGIVLLIEPARLIRS